MAVLNDTISAKSCDGCASSGCDVGQLAKLGVKADDCDYVIALAGNPNTGKSTVFNALTGLRQHVGNWAGKTVTRAEGAFNFNSKKYKLIDLPGTYSLLSTSTDEEIARDFILFGKPNVTVVVVDATRLERNLHLVLQVLEITDHAVIALNLIDEARRNNLQIDTRSLARDLGVPVVPMSARRGEGLNELLSAVERVAENRFAAKPHRIHYNDEELETTIEKITAQLQETFEDLPNARWVALRLLEGDESMIKAVQEKTLGKQINTIHFSQQLAQLERV